MAKKVEEKIEELEEKTLEQDVNEEMVKIDEEISKLTEENKVLTEKVKLAQAELINYRRRKDEETANILKFANQDLILELLPVVDNFERALESNSESSKFTYLFPSNIITTSIFDLFLLRQVLLLYLLIYIL